MGIKALLNFPSDDEIWFVQLPGSEKVVPRHVIDITHRTVLLRDVVTPLPAIPGCPIAFRHGDQTRFLRKDIRFIELAPQQRKYFELSTGDNDED